LEWETGASLSDEPCAGAGGLRSVVAATAQQFGFAYWRGVACNAFGRQAEKGAEPPIDDNPTKELQAAPLQFPADSAVAATTECSPPAQATVHGNFSGSGF